MENGIIESVAVYADSGPKHKTEKADRVNKTYMTFYKVGAKFKSKNTKYKIKKIQKKQKKKNKSKKPHK